MEAGTRTADRLAPRIDAERALYIKLGTGGMWEQECIDSGTLRIGYRQLPHDLCERGEWEEAVQIALSWSKDERAARQHINQVRLFYEEPDTTPWITFYSDRLWWCRAEREITILPDGSRIRRARGGWSDSDVNGKPLHKTFIGGRLLATQGFRGTICAVREWQYLMHRLNGTVPPQVESVQATLERLQAELIPIIQDLHDKDFEIFTDLIFRNGGLQRAGVVGEVERDIDLDLVSAVLPEKIGVQVKSRASVSVFEGCRDKFGETSGFTRFYFVTHSPTSDLAALGAEFSTGSFVYWGPEKLAALAVRNGLVDWLLGKAS